MSLSEHNYDVSRTVSIICKPKFRVQLFNRRGIYIVLLYNFAAMTALFFRSFPGTSARAADQHFAYNIAFAVAVCSFPLVGCLADNCFSRYRLIKYSMRLLWMLVVILCVVSIVFYGEDVCSGNSHLCNAVYITLDVLTMLGLGGFVTSIVQFSMDQLHDASSIEVTAFIVWHGWTWSCGAVIVLLSQICSCGVFRLASKLLFPASLGLALCVDFLCAHRLVKEPASQNPCRLFFGVIKYALKNKYPRQRSAFTYWGDQRYSRVNLAKDKYGGPFTTEQVEDVKTVLRMLVMLFFASLLIGMWFILSYYDGNVMDHLNGGSMYERNIGSTSCAGVNVVDCFKVLVPQYFGYFFIFVFIPVHEFVIYPLAWKRILQVPSYWKFNLGLLFVLFYYVALLIIEAVGHHYVPDGERANLTCVLSSKRAFTRLPISYMWFYLPQVFNGLGRFYMGYSSLQFVCSQAPYSMKGMLFGFLYFFIGIGMLFFSLLLLPVAQTVDGWKPVAFGCGVWFYLSVVLVILLFIVLSVCCFTKVYKPRRRDEELHNRHIFAINYYSRYTTDDAGSDVIDDQITCDGE